MPRYLVIVPHKNSVKACNLAIKTFRSTGSHFLRNADFGCHDNVHKAWMIVDANNKRDAKRIVPTPYKAKVKVIKVEKLALDNVEKEKKYHKA